MIIEIMTTSAFACSACTYNNTLTAVSLDLTYFWGFKLFEWFRYKRQSGLEYLCPIFLLLFKSIRNFWKTKKKIPVVSNRGRVHEYCICVYNTIIMQSIRRKALRNAARRGLNRGGGTKRGITIRRDIAAAAVLSPRPVSRDKCR